MLIRGSSHRALAVSLLFPWLLFPSPQLAEEAQPAVETPPAPRAEALTGVVVESVGGWTLEKAGVQAGDVLLSWKRLPAPPVNPEPAEGVLAGYFDWEELLIEQAPRGTVVLTGRRGEEAKEFNVKPGLWDAKVRPVLSPVLEAVYERGRAELARGEVKGAVATWRGLVETVPVGDGRDLEAWMLLRMGEAWGEKGEWDKAAKLAREMPQGDGQARGLTASWDFVGRSSAAAGRYVDAEAAYRSGMALLIGSPLHSLRLAVLLNDLGEVVGDRGALTDALGLFLEALKVSEATAPQSLLVARTLNNLGVVAKLKGDSARAQDLFSAALRIQGKLATDSATTAVSLANLGVTARESSSFDLALDYFIRAMRIRQSLDPESLGMSTVLNNIGELLWSRSSLSAGIVYYQHALEIRQRLAPGTLALSTSLNNMGQVFQAQGDLRRAKAYFLRALAIERHLAPESLTIAVTLENIALLLRATGELEDSEKSLREVLRIKRRLAPDSLGVAMSLNNLGFVLQLRGRLSQAGVYYRQSLGIKASLDPGSLNIAITFANLGRLERKRGELDSAKRNHHQAVESIEKQLARLGGSYDVVANFRTQHRDFFFNLLDLLLTQKNFPEAFQTLERFRAQTFLAMLAERDIAFSADIPEELDRERRRVGVLYDRTLKKLEGLNPRDHAKEIEEAREDLRRLDDRAGDIEVEIRKASPRLAALRYPEPLDAERTRQALDPGTLLLSWSLGKDKSALFTLGHEAALEVHTIPLGEEALRAKVQHLLTILPEAQGDSTVAVLRRNQLQAASRELFDLLLAPAAERIAASERLLILPDGPLHALPFGALIHRTASAEGERDEYLAAWKPLHVALSATVFAELKNRRRGPPDARVGTEAPPLLAAFGDPVYPQHLAALKELPVEAVLAAAAPQSDRIDPTVRGAAERGLFDFAPLPYTRREVEGISSLFPIGTARTFLGAEALEDRVKTLDPKTRILHLAAHAGIDEHLPSGSFIALTVPADTPEVEGQPTHDNGLLQVWEIVERVRLDADLVVLSACESGLGKELGGEGLIGLTRAFQYAGARSVMASLWNVNDQATAELMIRFYRHLRAGKTKDEALRSAQRELIEGPIEIVDEKGEKHPFDASAPYYWAAFQVYGDWK